MSERFNPHNAIFLEVVEDETKVDPQQQILANELRSALLKGTRREKTIYEELVARTKKVTYEPGDCQGGQQNSESWLLSQTSE